MSNIPAAPPPPPVKAPPPPKLSMAKAVEDQPTVPPPAPPPPVKERLIFPPALNSEALPPPSLPTSVTLAPWSGTIPASLSVKLGEEEFRKVVAILNLSGVVDREVAATKFRLVELVEELNRVDNDSARAEKSLRSTPKRWRRSQYEEDSLFFSSLLKAKQHFLIDVGGVLEETWKSLLRQRFLLASHLAVPSPNRDRELNRRNKHLAWSVAWRRAIDDDVSRFESKERERVRSWNGRSSRLDADAMLASLEAMAIQAPPTTRCSPRRSRDIPPQGGEGLAEFTASRRAIIYRLQTGFEPPALHAALGAW